MTRPRRTLHSRIPRRPSDTPASSSSEAFHLRCNSSLGGRQKMPPTHPLPWPILAKPSRSERRPAASFALLATIARDTWRRSQTSPAASRKVHGPSKKQPNSHAREEKG
eukprot:1790418-Pyramimonas_sp.AAC.1